MACATRQGLRIALLPEPIGRGAGDGGGSCRATGRSTPHASCDEARRLWHTGAGSCFGCRHVEALWSQRSKKLALNGTYGKHYSICRFCLPTWATFRKLAWKAAERLQTRSDPAVTALLNSRSNAGPGSTRGLGNEPSPRIEDHTVCACSIGHGPRRLAGGSLCSGQAQYYGNGCLELQAGGAADPDFVKESGIEVDLQVLPYPQVRQKSMADFVSGTANSDVYGRTLSGSASGQRTATSGRLDDLIARDIPSSASWRTSYRGAFNALSKWDGKTWTMPFGAYYFLMYYRPGCLRKGRALGSGHAGRCRRRCRETHGQEAEFLGISMPYQRGGPISSWFLATYTGAGGKLLKNPPADFAPTLNSPEALKVLEALLELDEGGPQCHRPSLERPDRGNAVRSVRMAPAFSINGSRVRQARRVRDRWQGRLHHDAASHLRPAPVIPFGGWGIGINAKTIRSEDSWTFIKWVTSANVQKAARARKRDPVRYSALRDAKVQETVPLG